MPQNPKERGEGIGIGSNPIPITPTMDSLDNRNRIRMPMCSAGDALSWGILYHNATSLKGYALVARALGTWLHSVLMEEMCARSAHNRVIGVEIAPTAP